MAAARGRGRRARRRDRPDIQRPEVRLSGVGARQRSAAPRHGGRARRGHQGGDGAPSRDAADRAPTPQRRGGRGARCPRAGDRAALYQPRRPSGPRRRRPRAIVLSFADEQGARLRRGEPRPAGHGLVRRPPRPRRRRARHRPDQAPGSEHEPQPRATPSLAYPELPDPECRPNFQRTIAPSRSRLPGIVRAIHRIAQPPSTQERTR
jgi:hypothetical protein